MRSAPTSRQFGGLESQSTTKQKQVVILEDLKSGATSARTAACDRVCAPNCKKRFSQASKCGMLLGFSGSKKDFPNVLALLPWQGFAPHYPDRRTGASPWNTIHPVARRCLPLPTRSQNVFRNSMDRFFWNLRWFLFFRK